jgi:hypothetical protein
VPAAQAFWHEPQFRASLSVLTHTPPQFVLPGGQAHAPATHEVPPVQLTPQAPQFALSVWISTQAPLQVVWFGGHCCTQTPALQNVPVAQA